MLLFTWNLKKSEKAFRLAIAHLRQAGEAFVAAFQELPTKYQFEAAVIEETRELSAGDVQCLCMRGSRRTPGRVGIFASGEISSGAVTQDKKARTAIVSIAIGNDGPELTVVAIHGLDRRNYPHDYTRTPLAKDLRAQVDSVWTRKHPLIVMGDFNAEPYDPEISTESGIFALRDRSEVYNHENGDGPLPLYNPMWHLLPEAMGHEPRPGGSYWYRTPAYGIRWRLSDQILVSRELVEVLAGPPTIISEINGERLTNPDGTPDRGEFSDHLPVQLRIRLGSHHEHLSGPRSSRTDHAHGVASVE